jgi:hypothetical protein
VINEIITSPQSNAQSLTEYNFINPYNITNTHILNLPSEIQFKTPIISSSAILSDLVYYLALNSTDNSSMIIVYRLGTIAVSSLYQIIPYNKNLISPNNLILTAASLLNSQEILILNDISQNTTSSWIINLYPTMKIQTSDHLTNPMEINNTYLQTNNLQNFSFQLQVTGWPLSISQTLNLSLFVINPLVILYPNTSYN